MNQKEWKLSKKYDGKYSWYNKTRKIQKSLKYNSNPNAVVIHHLRDTEEQRKYNDEHYELWGFEICEDGNEHFEYGKYIIFLTKEDHDLYHQRSDETRKKISDGVINAINNGLREKRSSLFAGEKKSNVRKSWPAINLFW